jgi:hypothetical protein
MTLKHQIRNKTRKLSANYSTQSIQDDILEQMAREIAKEIDQSIINSMVEETLKDDGWVNAPFKTGKFLFPSVFRLDEVTAWLQQNTIAPYRIIGDTFWFQNEKDLTAFILKWS